MSYDLSFYKRKTHQLSEKEICDYLTTKLTPPNENGNEWSFENGDTEVYYSFNLNGPETDPYPIESFNDFDNTHFSFNLNFFRPNFFGIEAFNFVETFMSDLDLYVLDTQSADAENPRKIPAREMLATWAETNTFVSANKFEEYGLTYFPIDKSDDTWNYNFHRKELQEKLGDGYFVPKMFMMKTKTGNGALTLATWTQHIPMVIPPADYYLLMREYKKWFRTVKEMGLISYETLMKNFGGYFEDFDFRDCKIIRPSNAAKIKDIFNSVKFEHQATDYCERISMDKLSNVEPH